MSDEDITLREHLSRIQSSGGKARAAKLSPKQRSSIGRKGGKVGGKAAAAAMTPEERSERARKAAVASAVVRQRPQMLNVLRGLFLRCPQGLPRDSIITALEASAWRESLDRAGVNVPDLADLLIGELVQDGSIEPRIVFGTACYVARQ